MPAASASQWPEGSGHGRRHHFPRSHEAGGPEDQDEHQQEIGNDRRELRDRHLPQVAEVAAARAGAEKLGKGGVHRHREGLDQADQQRGDEGAGERAKAADDDDDEQDRPEQPPPSSAASPARARR